MGETSPTAVSNRRPFWGSLAKLGLVPFLLFLLTTFLLVHGGFLLIKVASYAILILARSFALVVLVIAFFLELVAFILGYLAGCVYHHTTRHYSTHRITYLSLALITLRLALVTLALALVWFSWTLLLRQWQLIFRASLCGSFITDLGPGETSCPQALLGSTSSSFGSGPRS